MRRSRKQEWEEWNQERFQLRARIGDLELRMKLLEARVRNLVADRRREGAQIDAAQQSKQARRSRVRPRCPGCLLELPPGRRGEKCVWCGFRFDALRILRRDRPVRARARRRRSAAPVPSGK